MDFGKVADSQLAEIDFKLPPLSQMRANSPGTQRLGIGCPVWSVKTWVGDVYPARTEAKDYLKMYSQQFNSIELNTTHYRTPDASLIRRWKDETPATFRFCPKILQEISHRRPLGGGKEQLGEVVRSLMSLDERLGLSFLQLPPNFSPDELPELRHFLAQLPQDFRLAVEVRHPAFFRQQMLIPQLLEVLEKGRAHTVITDVAGRRDVLHGAVLGSRVLVRFIGNQHPTDAARIAAWAERIAIWVRSGLSELEFFMHQPDDNRHAPAAVNQLIDLLPSDVRLGVEKWQPKTQGEQLGFFLIRD